jgi:serine/threonine-protein kinase
MSAETSSPGSVPIAPGEVLAGKYRVEQVLGVGGMGVVVAATHLQLGTKVALKFMLPEALRVPGLIERFSREARAAVRLRSDHVARVLDVGSLESGSPYMVMEFLEGSDLATIVEGQGPMSLEVAVDCVLQACDAVAEAHSLGIIHRDLKPRNLFLTTRNDGRGLVKVLDFGISKDRTGADLGLTRTTEIIGSPNYMSPEQLKSTRAADERSDIWALGVILYELLTGRVPFVAESITQLTAMVLTEPPRPITQLRPDVPRDLVRTVERCLEKEPDKRFASVAQLAAALERFAPADTRPLAARIARIGAGGRQAPPASPSSTGGVPVAGSTSVSWAGKTELATGRGKAIAVVAAAVVLLGGGAIAGGVLLMRSHGARSEASPAAPASAAAAPATRPSAPPGPTETLAPLASRPAVAAAVVVDAGAVAAPAQAPRQAGPAPGGPAAQRRGEPAPGGSTNEAPKFRTSW